MSYLRPVMIFPQNKTRPKWFCEPTNWLSPDLQLRPQRHRVLGGVVPQPLPLTPGSGRGRQSRASKHRVRRQGESPILSIWFPDIVWFLDSVGFSSDTQSKKVTHWLFNAWCNTVSFMLTFPSTACIYLQALLLKNCSLVWYEINSVSIVFI